MLYLEQAQFPLSLLCYDLSHLSTRVTGDVYMSQELVHDTIVKVITIKSSFLSVFKQASDLVQDVTHLQTSIGCTLT